MAADGATHITRQAGHPLNVPKPSLSPIISSLVQVDEGLGQKLPSRWILEVGSVFPKIVQILSTSLTHCDMFTTCYFHTLGPSSTQN